MKPLVLILCLCLIVLAATPLPAAAQLLYDRVEGEQRLCVYVGSDQLADGQTLPRNTVVAASQPCPALPPFRDPNQRVPGNAALLRDNVQNGQRQCVYGQGGVEYYRAIPATRFCAATPDLLDRLTAGPDPAAPFAR